MTITFANLTEEIISLLMGYTRLQDQSTYLSGSLTNSAVSSIAVGNGTKLALGRAEIDDEIIQIDSISSNTLTLAPYGRGMDGTSAVSHAANARVTYNPMFPRYRVKRAINDTINSINIPVVFRTTVTADQCGDYNLPSGCTDILSVQWEGIDKYWGYVPSWDFVRSANTTDYASGKSVRVKGIPIGRPIMVTYIADPAPLVASTDVFETVSGLPSSCIDVVTYGAAWRLTSAIDLSQFDTESMSAESGQPNQLVATQLSQQMYKMFTLRREEERRKIVERNGARAHLTGS